MKPIFSLLIILLPLISFSQKKATFDLANYTIPSSWQEASRTQNVVSYQVVNNQTGTYCQVGVYATTASKGSLQADFESEWEQLVVPKYKPTTKPELVPGKAEGGWQGQGGIAPFIFNGGNSLVMLVTTTGYSRCMSFLILTNTDAYNSEIENFLASVQMSPPANTQGGSSTNSGGGSAPPAPAKSTPAAASTFAFTTTNFDDGWTSTAQEDWVEVVKGNMKVLIHYPNAEADKYDPDGINKLKMAWNLLVSTRYSSAPNLAFKNISGWQSIQFAEADAVDLSGKKVHVVFFKKNYSGGTGRYLEVITPDKATFDAAFGGYDGDADSWGKLEVMQNYNKFAVSAADLKGKWSNDFGATQQFVNAYTGAYAGMTAYSSKENFEFGPGTTYKWDIAVASGMVGNQKFQGAKSNGTFTVPNPWQVAFSDIEGKPRTYSAYFVCVKGARILWLDEIGYAKL